MKASELGMLLFFCAMMMLFKSDIDVKDELSHYRSDKQIMNTKYKHSLKYVKIAYRMDSTLKANNIKETFILID